MDNLFILDLLEKSRMVNIEQGMNIYHLLTQTILLKIPGDIVEVGCYKGNTAAIMQKTLDQFKSIKRLHVYDSFLGLPKIGKNDKIKAKFKDFFREGGLGCDDNDLILVFRKNKLRLPIIHKGWFKDTLSSCLPYKICFAHIDSDLYDSIYESLENIYPRLAAGAIVVIDDYYDKDIHPKIVKKLNSNLKNKNLNRKYKTQHILPAVKEAVDKFLSDKEENINILISGDERHAYFKKK